MPAFEQQHSETKSPGLSREEWAERLAHLSLRYYSRVVSEVSGANEASLRHDKLPRCVLIVEDDEDSREMLSELVSAFGHRPVQAANAEEALARVRDERPDVALIDIGLPEVDGCELARLLRQVMLEAPELKTRLVALTGYSDGPMRESAVAAGFDAYVVKPILPEALEALLGT